MTRGVYGQPDPNQPKKRSWLKIALVAGGVGAVGYFFVWPAIRDRLARGQAPAELPPGAPTTAPLQDPEAATVTQVATAAVTAAQQPPASPVKTESEEPLVPVPSIDPIAKFAADHGFSSVADYENSALLHARQLKRDGAHVTFGPHLAHLMPRLDRK